MNINYIRYKIKIILSHNFTINYNCNCVFSSIEVLNDRQKITIPCKSNQHFSPHIFFFRIIAHKLRVLHVCTSILSSFFPPSVLFKCNFYDLYPPPRWTQLRQFFFSSQIKTKQRKRTLHAKHETSVPSRFSIRIFTKKKKKVITSTINISALVFEINFHIAKESKETIKIGTSNFDV